jgi:hypothetical protein
MWFVYGSAEELQASQDAIERVRDLNPGVDIVYYHDKALLTDDSAQGKKALFERILKEDAAFSLKDLVIDGNDIMTATGIKPGPLVGQVLGRLFEEVLDEPGLNDREKLLARAKAIVTAVEAGDGGAVATKKARRTTPRAEADRDGDAGDDAEDDYADGDPDDDPDGEASL